MQYLLEGLLLGLGIEAVRTYEFGTHLKFLRSLREAGMRRLPIGHLDVVGHKIVFFVSIMAVSAVQEWKHQREEKRGDEKPGNGHRILLGATDVPGLSGGKNSNRDRRKKE